MDLKVRIGQNRLEGVYTLVHSLVVGMYICQFEFTYNLPTRRWPSAFGSTSYSDFLHFHAGFPWQAQAKRVYWSPKRSIPQLLKPQTAWRRGSEWKGNALFSSWLEPGLEAPWDEQESRSEDSALRLFWKFKSKHCFVRDEAQEKKGPGVGVSDAGSEWTSVCHVYLSMCLCLQREPWGMPGWTAACPTASGAVSILLEAEWASWLPSSTLWCHRLHLSLWLPQVNCWAATLVSL